MAFEPVPATFERLASNVARLGCENVTLLNAAASDASRLIDMSIPAFNSGLTNFYLARIGGGPADLNVLSLTVDSLGETNRVALAKVDAEGHELQVLRGMKALLEGDRPVLIVEDNSSAIEPYLLHLGFSATRLPGSRNAIYQRGL